jgi:hypothetical protein
MPKPNTAAPATGASSTTPAGPRKGTIAGAVALLLSRTDELGGSR